MNDDLQFKIGEEAKQSFMETLNNDVEVRKPHCWQHIMPNNMPCEES